jgi:hypothetical protein
VEVETPARRATSRIVYFVLSGTFIRSIPLVSKTHQSGLSNKPKNVANLRLLLHIRAGYRGLISSRIGRVFR